MDSSLQRIAHRISVYPGESDNQRIKFSNEYVPRYTSAAAPTPSHAIKSFTWVLYGSLISPISADMAAYARQQVTLPYSTKEQAEGLELALL